MGPDRLLLLIAYLMPILSTVIATENVTIKIIDQHTVKKMNTSKRIYDGVELEPPPNELTVTEEVWFDMKISDYFGTGNPLRKRIYIACFGKLTPQTCQNFTALVRGYRQGELLFSYRKTKVQKIIRDFMIQLGDVRSRFLTKVKIHSKTARDEGFPLSHNHAGWVGMANFGAETNSSQFYIILRPARWLDGKHAIFGKVIRGMESLQIIGLEESDEGDRPLRSIIVDDCGVVGIKTPYILKAEQFNTDGDIDTGTV